MAEGKIKKVSIVCSKGSLEGMEAVTTKKMNKIKVATVGNPAMGIPTWIGAIPRISAMATRMILKTMDALDIPPIGEFIEMISDAGCKLYACKATVDMFKLSTDDFCPQVEKVLTVGMSCKCRRF